ncbi:DNA/RNA nuclease SfsA [Rhodospirillum rubrum]|uniref:DNA/RNA nuclease SfsA n=1 Tax=Rhodospirillum rubrum TaxID=1085 RepID=UPI001903CCE0|nr:DNA/RNA nuclease SfsA [Rhodospirillum rubrum]MBK1663641.1 DNA/RNA nuclease SfsA [Rhodospirillum rubrum]MBK1676977.1 DNA/RNA nuclease SfsA [Rhodospirillum rubrum]
MLFPTPLVEGRLVKRYMRFLADVILDDGTAVTAHCANSGSMASVKEPGSPVWLSESANPARKLKYTWEIIRVGDAYSGVNTGTPNAVVAEAIAEGKIPPLAGYARLRREVKYGKTSRIDILLEDDAAADDAPARPRCYVEVKNVTLKRDPAWDGPIDFPDAVTTRGAKHLLELADMVDQGHRAAMVYLVQRTDGGAVAMAADIDPAYAAGLKTAIAKGVEVYCLGCEIDPLRGIWVNRALPLIAP